VIGTNRAVQHTLHATCGPCYACYACYTLHAASYTHVIRFVGAFALVIGLCTGVWTTELWFMG
jgi:hypothetical protein